MMEEEIAALAARTRWLRYQFLLTELQTCSIALDMGHFELSQGETRVAAREVGAVAEGIRVLHRFLPEVSEEQQAELQPRIDALAAGLAELREKLNEASPSQASPEP